MMGWQGRQKRMELGGQIRRYRDELGLSQEELAERVFVTRQSVSNWENEKTYPDIHSLLLLSEVFSCSLDQLIKGDIEVMKQEISQENIKRMNWFSGVLGGLMLALILLPVPLLKWFDITGFLVVMGPLFLVTLWVGEKVERFKKENDVYTYREIVAFTEGKRLDELERERERGKRPYQQFLLAIGFALAAAGVAVALSWLLGR